MIVYLTPASASKVGAERSMEAGGEQRGSCVAVTYDGTATTPASGVTLRLEDGGLGSPRGESFDSKLLHEAVGSQINGLPVTPGCVLAAYRQGHFYTFVVQSVRVSGQSATAGRILSPQTKLIFSSRDGSAIRRSHKSAVSVALSGRANVSESALPQYLIDLFRTTPTFTNVLSELQVLLGET